MLPIYTLFHLSTIEAPLLPPEGYAIFCFPLPLALVGPWVGVFVLVREADTLPAPIQNTSQWWYTGTQSNGEGTSHTNVKGRHFLQDFERDLEMVFTRGSFARPVPSPPSFTVSLYKFKGANVASRC